MNGDASRARHFKIVELVILLDSDLEGCRSIDGVADELEAILDEQTDEEARRTTQYFERRVVRGELSLDTLAYIDYTRMKIARAYREAFSFLKEKCSTKLTHTTFDLYGRETGWQKIELSKGMIVPAAGKEMLRLLRTMQDPRAVPLAQALARFL